MTQARLAPGDMAPDFELPDQDGGLVKLSDFRGQKTIVYFYPAAATPGCTTQACDFRDNLSSLKSAGYAVLGISPDKTTKLAKWRAEESINFPLLSDEAREVATAYGAYGEKKMYGKTTMGIIRSTFVIDEDGAVADAMYNVRATGHVAKLRRDLGIDT